MEQQPNDSEITKKNNEVNIWSSVIYNFYAIRKTLKGHKLRDEEKKKIYFLV